MTRKPKPEEQAAQRWTWRHSAEGMMSNDAQAFLAGWRARGRQPSKVKDCGHCECRIDFKTLEVKTQCAWHDAQQRASMKTATYLSGDAVAKALESAAKWMDRSNVQAPAFVAAELKRRAAKARGRK